MIPTRSREWMITIGKLRRYQNTTRARRVLDDWKVKIIVAPDVMSRSLADRMGNAAGISAGHVYKIRRQHGKGRCR